MDDEEKKKRQELYAETRKDLLTRQLSNSEKFDGAILTLSTAALGFSLAFIKDVVLLSEAQEIWTLKASWWIFGVTIVSTLFSFITSQHGIKKQLDYAEKYYLKFEGKYLTKKNVPAIITDYLNYASALLFILALSLTIFFVSNNLGGKNIMAGDEGKPVQIQEGAPIPKMQSLEKGAPIPSMQAVPTDQPAPGPVNQPEPSQSGEGNAQPSQPSGGDDK